MFEVGKKYYHKLAPKHVCEVLFVGKQISFVCFENDDEQSICNENYCFFVEHKEPRKFVRYMNVYEDSVSPHHDRDAANKSAASDRLACVRIELTEGHFDD